MAAQYKESLGATVSGENSCSFLVWAPRANEVELHVTAPRELFLPLEAAEHGYFHLTTQELAPGALYRYRLNHEKERPDPASRYQPQGVHGPSEVVDNQFHWNDDAWPGLALEKYVLYELHVGTFTSEGTFDAIIPRIAALKNLGITAIEVMPVSQFPGNRNWGYDGVYPYAVQETYGGPAAFKRFVDACHQRGIAVVLDVVYNHMGPEGNYLSDFGPYFTDIYRTPWGEALNFDGPQSDEVRRYFIGNALQWVTDFHIDALRLDAVHAIVDPSARPFLQQLGIAVHEKAKELNREIYLFPESDRNDARMISPRELGGWGLDAVWNDDFHHALHVLLTGEQDGYYKDFHGIDDLARTMRQGFAYTGQYSEFRQRRHGNSSKEIPAKRFIVFAQNHDQVGNRRLGDRLSQLVSFEQLKLSAGVLLLSPYIPLLFMGEEYAESAPFQYFVSHGDPALIEAVRNGRKEEFTRFDWKGEIPDPQSEQTFLDSKVNWHLHNQGSHHILWKFYKELLLLRRDVAALATLDKDSLEVESYSEQKVLLVMRRKDSSRVFAAFNFDSEAKQVMLPVPTGRWKRILDSGEHKWGGSGDQPAEILMSKGEIQVSLSGYSFLIFENLSGEG